MSVSVWTTAKPEDPDVYPDSDTVQEYGGGNIRVWDPDGRKVIAHYAPGTWTKTLCEEWPRRDPHQACCHTKWGERADDGVTPLPIELPSHRDPCTDRLRAS
ncbi:hypothetical protein GCM10017691_24100 [Pseudonocardia petroleophila]